MIMSEPNFIAEIIHKLEIAEVTDSLARLEAHMSVLDDYLAQLRTAVDENKTAVDEAAGRIEADIAELQRQIAELQVNEQQRAGFDGILNDLGAQASILRNVDPVADFPAPPDTGTGEMPAEGEMPTEGEMPAEGEMPEVQPMPGEPGFDPGTDTTV